jgi:ABC-2 type transport system ATP-binding protein
MTGCLGATSGEVKIGGFDIFEQPEEAKRLIGFLPELPPLYLDRTPREYLRFVAEAKGVAAKEIPAQIDYVMQKTRIVEMADRLIKNLSKGYRQRVGIAQALLGNPEVIILDEPMVGLDPRQIIEIRDLIQELGKDHTVILSSHILSEVQAVCSTVMIIAKGKLIACDTPGNLEKLFTNSNQVNLVVEATKEETEQILSEVAGIKEFEITVQDDGNCAVKVQGKKDENSNICRDLFFAFSRGQRAILQMNVTKTNLEEIFIELTSGSKTEPKKEGK